MIKPFLSSFAAVSAAALSGCAVSGHSFLERSAPVKIATAPEGATATSNYGDSCVTPCSLRLLMSKGGTVTIAKDGYEPHVVSIGSRVSKTKAGIGTTADAAYYLDDPSPAVAAIDVLDALINPDAKYKDLDTYRIAVQLIPIGSAASVEEESTAASVDDDGVILLRPAGGR